jgi:biopolymer transport protein ExbB/TolQ
MARSTKTEGHWVQFKRYMNAPGPLSPVEELVSKLTGVAVVGLAGLFVMALVSWLGLIAQQPDLAERIRTLTGSLNSAARTISEIEGEIKKREELVRRLQSDAETASKLSALNKPQLDAVAQVLKSEIERDQRQSFWMAQGLAIFYTILGVALTELYHWIMRRRRRREIGQATEEPSV